MKSQQNKPISSDAMSPQKQAPTKDLINADAYLMTMMDTELEADGKGGDGSVNNWDHYFLTNNIAYLSLKLL